MSDDTRMHALFQALADDVEALSDEEVLADCREDGRSPTDVATQNALDSPERGQGVQAAPTSRSASRTRTGH